MQVRGKRSKKKNNHPSHQGPSKFTLSRNKGEIKIERNTKFPTGLADEHANTGDEDKRRSQIKPNENMDEVRESLCITVNETIVSRQATDIRAS